MNVGTVINDNDLNTLFPPYGLSRNLNLQENVDIDDFINHFNFWIN